MCGFEKFFSRFQFFSKALNPSDVQDIYTAGPYDGKRFDINFFKGGHVIQTAKDDLTNLAN